MYTVAMIAGQSIISTQVFSGDKYSYKTQPGVSVISVWKGACSTASGEQTDPDYSRTCPRGTYRKAVQGKGKDTEKEADKPNSL
jgi:hypothetical protein